MNDGLLIILGLALFVYVASQPPAMTRKQRIFSAVRTYAGVSYNGDYHG